MNIELTNETIEGEPGPNIYFGGSMEDFYKLSEALEILIQGIDTFIVINELDFCQIVNPNLEIIFKSIEGGKILSKIDSEKFIVELDSDLWEKIFIKCVLLSRDTGHFYIEFDDLDLVEECNIIWSSEWEYAEGVV